MRISDWSSDVCSSDLAAEVDIEFADGTFSVAGTDRRLGLAEIAAAAHDPARLPPGLEPGLAESSLYHPSAATRPDGRRVGKECDRTCRSQWVPYHQQKKSHDYIALAHTYRLQV